tara:strand:- start:2233 stop:3456 length:1224 start_codon:yes stop_codon:yes gene_type:complete
MALFNKLGGMFTDNPVNRVGPTGEPNIGGSNVTDLIARSAGGLLGRDMRTEASKLTEGIQGIEQNDPDRLRKMVELQLQSAVRAGDRPAAAQFANTLERIKDQEYTAAQFAKPKVSLSSGIRKKDSAGNFFVIYPSAAGGSNNTITNKIIPEVAGTVPQGKLLDVDQETGLTYDEQVNLDAKSSGASTLAKKRAETFAETEADVIKAGTTALGTIDTLEDVEEYINSPEFSSGGAASLVSGAKEFFGIEEAEVGQFKRETARILTEALQAFTGAISEGERNYLEANLAGMKRSTEINRALIADTLKVLRKAQERANAMSNGVDEKGDPWTSRSWYKYLEKETVFSRDQAKAAKKAQRASARVSGNTAKSQVNDGQGPLMSKQNIVDTENNRLIRPQTMSLDSFTGKG